MERFAVGGPYLPSRWSFRGRHCCEVNRSSSGGSPRNITARARVRHPLDTREAPPGTLTLACTIEPTAAYPFELSLQARFSLDGQGFRTDVAATNVGARRTPYDVCPHPYLIGGPSPLDEWVLELPASTVLTVTSDRLLPVAKEPVTGTLFDFRSARAIGNVQIDHAFTGLTLDHDGRAIVRVIDPAFGTGTAMVWDASCPWVQIHTADLPGRPESIRLGLAVEPMTCPPEAFNTGEDLVVLEPGSRTARAGRSPPCGSFTPHAAPQQLPQAANILPQDARPRQSMTRNEPPKPRNDRASKK